MIAILIILGSLIVVGSFLYFHDRVTYKPHDPQENTLETTTQTDEACCGLHIACEKDSLSTAASDEIIYYDDEELDRHKGKPSDSYSPQEIEEFRDILLTLIPTDIAGWARSLQLREIELPEAVRDELLMVVAEARTAKNTATEASKTPNN